MEPDEKMRYAAGETDELPPAPRAQGGPADPGEGTEPTGLTEADAVRKDMRESPSSEAETADKQTDPLPDGIGHDIDVDAIKVAPGTGGPDDAGDIEVDPADIDPTGHA